jgi:phage/plasmid-associated DNA primase
VHQPNQQEPAPKTKENQGEEINLASCRSDWLPLVMQHVFMPNGERWVSVENILHQWTGTHYGSVADLELAPKVAKFLGRLSYYDEKTGEDVHEWGRPARVDEAIKWLKRQTAASIEDFNPANALNLQNGVLSWSWEDRKLVTRLDPHDPSQRFTYCQGYGYDPHASRDTLDKLLKAVEESEQDTFQRVMGSGLELARYRAVQGRPRAILAIGDGQNGKDTLQGAMSETLGNRGFTHCSIGDFQQYDKGRKFPLAPLYGSRINWSSENTGYARLESIQSLKTAITGERMSYEVKNVQEIPYSPNTLLIFNCNDAPRLDASSAAMESRWHVMAFRKRFTSRPDPSKPNELQADPRLKDDHQFIREAVCPAMLNWLLEGLQLAVSEGISYNPDSEALEAVRRQSCHLFDFVDDVGLAADPHGEVEASYVFELLLNWYQDQRILHLDPSTKRPSWNTHDLGGDHPVKIPRDLKARLRAVFPELRSERGTDKSRRSVLKGVRFVSADTNSGGMGAPGGGTAEARAEA